MTLFFCWLLPAPMVSEVVGNGCKMILTTFYYTLVLWKNALNCIPWAGDDPVLLLAVSLEAIIGRTNFFHFPHQLTSLSMRKVVKVMCQFWWILPINVGCTVRTLGKQFKCCYLLKLLFCPCASLLQFAIRKVIWEVQNIEHAEVYILKGFLHST